MGSYQWMNAWLLLDSKSMLATFHMYTWHKRYNISKYKPFSNDFVSVACLLKQLGEENLSVIDAPNYHLWSVGCKTKKSGRKVKVLNWSTSAWGWLLPLENTVKPSLSGFNSHMKSLLNCLVRLSRFLKKSIEWWSVLYMEETIKPGVNPQTFGKFLTNLSTCDILTWYRKKAMNVWKCARSQWSVFNQLLSSKCHKSC